MSNYLNKRVSALFTKNKLRRLYAARVRAVQRDAKKYEALCSERGAKK